MQVSNKTELVPIRLSPEQVTLIRKAAAEDGERLSTWIRQAAIRQAKQVTTDWAA